MMTRARRFNIFNVSIIITLPTIFCFDNEFFIFINVCNLGCFFIPSRFTRYYITIIFFWTYSVICRNIYFAFGIIWQVDFERCSVFIFNLFWERANNFSLAVINIIYNRVTRRVSCFIPGNNSIIFINFDF